MNVRRYQDEDGPRIARLNDRLVQGGVTQWPVYPEAPHDNPPGCPISSRLFVAQDEDEVRGAVWLREHGFRVGGEDHRFGWAKYPVAESLVNPAYGGVPGALLIRLIREQPRLMALGLGGHGGTFARLLQGMRWKGVSVPFYIRIERPTPVLRHLPHLRGTPKRRAAADLLAFSGLGWLGWQAASLGMRATRSAPPEAAYDVVEDFGDWADAVWQRARDRYAFVMHRDAAMLNVLYPKHQPFVRLRVRADNRDVGWVVVVRREKTAAFGPLRVGVIADCLAEPEHAAHVTGAAVAWLRRADVDLMFSNQLHAAWGAALRSAGFLSVTSQFAFYRSPKLEAVLADRFPEQDFHVNRGDCDGPMFA